MALVCLGVKRLTSLVSNRVKKIYIGLVFSRERRENWVGFAQEAKKEKRKSNIGLLCTRIKKKLDRSWVLSRVSKR